MHTHSESCYVLREPWASLLSPLLRVKIISNSAEDIY